MGVLRAELALAKRRVDVTDLRAQAAEALAQRLTNELGEKDREVQLLITVSCGREHHRYRMVLCALPPLALPLNLTHTCLLPPRMLGIPMSGLAAVPARS